MKIGVIHYKGEFCMWDVCFCCCNCNFDLPSFITYFISVYCSLLFSAPIYVLFENINLYVV